MQQYAPGERIGGEFEVLEVFGGRNKSGMGVVYLVNNRELPYPIVLKTAQNLETEEKRRRFAAEAHAWIRAGAHANIVQAYWVREVANQLYIGAEFVRRDEEGRNVLTQFLEEGQLRLETIIFWSTHFCRGMRYAQSKGVLAHRDIKPDNLMIDSVGNLKVTDFGLAKSVDLTVPFEGKGFWHGRELSSQSPANTQVGSVFGTPPYMAPEQFGDATAVDHRADIYAFGIILYQMASGNRYPYQIPHNSPDTLYEFFVAHSAQSPIRIESALMPIISRCLEKKPARRYAGYDKLLGDLEDLARRCRIVLPKEAITGEREDEELYAQAQSYVALGEKGRALAAINKYVSKFEDRACGWTEKGRIHIEREEYSEAIAATRHSLSLYPYNTHAWNNLGILLNRTGAPISEIKSAYSQALSYDPQNSVAMMNLIGPLVTHQDYSEAAALAARALRLRPDKPIVLTKAQSLLPELIEHHDPQACKILLEGWTAARPKDIDAWHNLALIYLQGRDHDQAIICFERVRELAPEDTFAITELAKLYFHKKQGRKCVVCCNLLLERGYEQLLAVSLKARVISFMGGYEAAVQFLQPYILTIPRTIPYG